MQLRNSTTAKSKAPKSATKTASKRAAKKAAPKKPAPKKAAPKKAASKTSTKATKTAKDGSVSVGDLIPDLTLLNQDGEEVNVRQLAKDAHILVVFLYPRASTPGCTRQAKGFRDEYDELTKLGATVAGLSSDSPNANERFKERQGLQYQLLCDPSWELIGALGAKKQPKGTIRSHFIFVDGVLKVARIKISPEASFQGALKEVQEL